MRQIEDGTCVVVNAYGQYPAVCNDLVAGMALADSLSLAKGGRWVVLVPHYSSSCSKEIKRKLHNVKHETDVIKESNEMLNSIKVMGNAHSSQE